jgi:Ca2+-binding RTX toxin-like protein
MKFYHFGGNTYVVGNTTADMMADFQIEITGTHNLTVDNFLGLSRAVLSGTSGGDTLRGTAGNDMLSGLGGTDVLIGKGGKDTLFGGLDADTFRFGAAAESAPGANRDVIRDWETLDIIDLDPLDANTSVAGNQDFAFIGLGAANQTIGQGQVKYYHFGGNTYVVGNATPDTTADFQIEITGTHALSSAHFVGLI